MLDSHVTDIIKYRMIVIPINLPDITKSFLTSCTCPAFNFSLSEFKISLIFILNL